MVALLSNLTEMSKQYMAPDLELTEFEIFDIISNMYVGGSEPEETSRVAIIDWR